MTSTSDDNDNDADDDYTRFELISLHGSPFSQRVQWALRVLEVDDYALLKHKVCARELWLRWKVGNYNPYKPCTVPQAIISYPNNSKPMTLILDHGWDIVDWACDVAKKRGDNKATSLIPSEDRKQVLQYCNMADEIMEYDRGKMLGKLVENPQILKLFLEEGETPPPDFLLPVIVRISSLFMKTKYKSTLHNMAGKRKRIDGHLDKVESVIQDKWKKSNNGSDDKSKCCFFVGDSLTLADIYLCVATYNPKLDTNGDDKNDNDDDDDDANKAESVPQPATTDTTPEWNIRKQYPIVYEWAAAMSKHYGR